ncbi:plasmid mobilization relaxosome protein MobC [Parapedobacter sp. ISTM3]|uniref:MobC family plasmid mobilization relaxosome protein n=1 Tax=Parapedobacter sp. ISTM3 TaxID=2800130 RepID=UPI00190640C1|nr:MobC family plasmid mobilization relaxosome protein [Parapedobacter sp. ISTM3]MBK1442567.1 plasmid mobilization relaxosome protein MobC [Parapedobacter sp. ISTM3]
MKKLAKENGTDGKKRTRGRPKKAITRSVSLVVRLTPTERLAIANRAKSAGMVISEWFRKTARTAVVRPRLSKEEASHLRTLSGMANNLNQLTKLAHTGGLVTIMADLRRLLGEVERLMERIGKDDS